MVSTALLNSLRCDGPKRFGRAESLKNRRPTVCADDRPDRQSGVCLAARQQTHDRDAGRAATRPVPLCLRSGSTPRFAPSFSSAVALLTSSGFDHSGSARGKDERAEVRDVATCLAPGRPSSFDPVDRGRSPRLFVGNQDIPVPGNFLSASLIIRVVLTTFRKRED